jgi:hypothetical protein
MSRFKAPKFILPHGGSVYVEERAAELRQTHIVLEMRCARLLRRDEYRSFQQTFIDRSMLAFKDEIFVRGKQDVNPSSFGRREPGSGK